MRRLVIILLGVAIMLALILVTGKKKSPFGKSNSSISVPADVQIDLITMERDGSLLSLSRENDRKWIINGKTEARSSAVSFILQTLHTIEIKSPVTDQYFRENIEEPGISPVKVEAFSSGRRVSSFMVYRYSDSPLGNIVRRKAGSKPFIAHIPGYDLNPGSHFITDARFWIPYNIFSLDPADIDTVRFTSGGREIPDLLIASGQRGYDLFIGGERPERADTTAIRRYLAYFTFVPFENWAYELNDEQKLEIIANEPAYVIGVTGKDGLRQKLVLWKRYIDENNGRDEDTDRLWGSLNGGADIFIARYFDIDPLLKSPDYFISD
jgi:hypothetical protein